MYSKLPSISLLPKTAWSGMFVAFSYQGIHLNISGFNIVDFGLTVVVFIVETGFSLVCKL